VPEYAKTDELIDLIAYFHTMLQRVDSSLLEEWESLLHPREEAVAEAARPLFDLALHPKLLVPRVRAELHALVRALAAEDFEEAALRVRQDPSDPWDAERFERALAPFRQEYERILFTPQARRADRTLVKKRGPRGWDVSQVLVDPLGEELWAIHGEVDLSEERDPPGPLVRVLRIGP
jgi:hypothetical protein